MKVPNITGFISSAARYFIQSSWKGRSVQVLCAVSFLALIYYVAFRGKKNPPPSGTTIPKAAAENPSAAGTLHAGSTSIAASAARRPASAAAAVIAHPSYVKTSLEPAFLQYYPNDDAKTQFRQQLSDVTRFPHYKFAEKKDLFSYLGLRSQADFSRLFGGKDCRSVVGEIERLDFLYEKSVPSIEKLRQLLCFLHITKNEQFLRPLIEEEIKQCIAALDELALLSGKKYYDEIDENLSVLHSLFDELHRNFIDWETILKQIEQADIRRQLTMLRGYVLELFDVDKSSVYQKHVNNGMALQEDYL